MIAQTAVILDIALTAMTVCFVVQQGHGPLIDTAAVVQSGCRSAYHYPYLLPAPNMNGLYVALGGHQEVFSQSAHSGSTGSVVSKCR